MSETANEQTEDAAEAKGPSLDEIRHQEEKKQEETPDDVSGDADDAKTEEAEAADDVTSEEGDDDAEKAEEKPDENAVPETAAEYDVTLPDIGLKDEKGDVLQFEPGDPLVEEFTAIAHEAKLTQGAVSKMLGLFAKSLKESSEVGASTAREQGEAAVAAELKKLETKDSEGKVISAEVRIGRVLKGIDAVLGDGASSKFSKGLTSAETVLLVEKLTSRVSDLSGQLKDSKGTKDLRGAALLDHIRGREKD